jgi:hypothetical protein
VCEREFDLGFAGVIFGCLLWLVSFAVADFRLLALAG